jgi:hypothetical protein
MDELRKKLIQVLLLIVLIITFGTAGYMVIEGWNFLDSVSGGQLHENNKILFSFPGRLLRPNSCDYN